MKITLGGVRGTSSMARSEFMRYGGETTSVLVEGRAGETVILDAGTGIRALSESWSGKPPSEVLLLLTHYHLDHIVGWPSFSLLYRKGVAIRVASSLADGPTVESVLSQLMKQPFWPVQMDSVQAEVSFEETPSRFGELRISSCPVHHPGGCVAYRLEEPATGASVVFATDFEWALSSPEEQARFLALCQQPEPCRLLMFDGHYSRATYPAFKGWGHSTWEEAVEVAKKAGAGQLLVIHHAPDSQDDTLERLDRRLQAAYPGSSLARGGMEVEL